MVVRPSASLGLAVLLHLAGVAHASSAQPIRSAGSLSPANINAATASQPLDRITFGFRDARQRAVGLRPATNIISVQRPTSTTRFVVPVAATINGEAFTEINVDSKGLLTLTGSPGERSLDEWLPVGATAEISVTNGDGFRFHVVLSRNGDTLIVLRPAIASASTTSATPVQTVTIYGTHFSLAPAENTILFTLPDGRIFHTAAKRADTTAIDVVLPLLPTGDNLSFYQGPLLLAVYTAPGYTSSSLTLNMQPLPNLTAPPGTLTTQVATDMSSLVGATASAGISSLVAAGTSDADIQALTAGPEAALALLKNMANDAAAGRPESFDIMTSAGPRRIVVDSAAITLFERLLLASNAQQRVHTALARVRAAQLDATCGPTAAEANILDRQQAWADLDFTDDVIAAIKAIAGVITIDAALAIITEGGDLVALLPALPAVAAADCASLAAHVLVGADWIKLQRINVQPSASPVAPGATVDVTIEGVFQSPLVGYSLRNIVETVVEKATEDVGGIVGTALYDIFGRLIEMILDYTLGKIENIDLPHVATRTFPLSNATTTVSVSAGSVVGPCDGKATITVPKTSLTTLAYEARANKFTLLVDENSSSVTSGSLAIDGTQAAPIAKIDLVSGSTTAQENGNLRLMITPGSTKAVTMSGQRSTDPSGGALTYQWSVDGMPAGATSSVTTGIAVGTHTVALTVRNATGKTGSATASITADATATAPVAGFTARYSTQSATEGQTLTINATTTPTTIDLLADRSFDPSGNALTYHWDIGNNARDGRSIEIPLPIGTYPITLVVTSNSDVHATATGVIKIDAAASSQPVITNITPIVAQPGDVPIIVGGSNFNPASAIVLIAGPSCPACVINNGDLTTKTTTTLAWTSHNLQAGSYGVAVSNATNGILSNVALLTVAATPTTTITITPTVLTFDPTGAQRLTQNANITASGAWHAGTSSAWLSISSTSGNGSAAIGVTADATGLQPGTYTATVTATLDGTAQAAACAVTLHVAAPTVPSLSVINAGQYDASGIIITENGNTNSTTITFRLTPTSSAGGTVTAEIEVRPVTQSFSASTGSATVASGNEAVLHATLSVGSYHWRYRATDGTHTSPWTEYGTSGNTDFTITTTGISLQVTPTSWEPVFDVAGAAVAIVLQVSAHDGSHIKASVTATTDSGGQWLLVNGQESDTFTTPGGISMMATPGILAPGTYTGSVNINATGTPTSSSVPVTMKIRPLLMVTTTSLPDAVSGMPYAAALQATGGDTYTWAVTNGTLPNGLSLNPNTGAITGTPGEPTTSPTTTTLTFQVRDQDSRTTTRDLSISWRRGVQVTGPASTQLTLGVDASAFLVHFQATGGTGSYTWTSTGLGPGLSVDTNGAIVGIPTSAGTYNATITATDTQGLKGSAPFTAVVIAQTLKITDANGNTPVPPNGMINTAYSYNLAAQGGNHNYTWSYAGTLPPGFSAIPVVGGSLYQIAGTTAQAGKFVLTIKLADSTGASTQTDLPFVISSGTPPTITTSSIPRATVGTTYTTTFAATGGTPPYTFSFATTSPDAGLTLGTDGTLSGVAQAPGDCSGGLYDGAGFNPRKNFTVQVTDSAQPPQSSTKGFCLVAYYPTPTIASITPNQFVIDRQTHTFTVTGTGFRAGAVMNDTQVLGIPTSVVSPTSLTFNLYASNQAPVAIKPDGSSVIGAQSLNLRVREDYTDYSNTSGFTIYLPPPSITNITAVQTGTTTACHANQDCQLLLTGDGFLQTAYMSMSSTPSITGLGGMNSNATVLPWTTMTTTRISVPAGSYTITITNQRTAPGINPSASATFTMPP